MNKVTTELFGHYGCYLGCDESKYIVTHSVDMELEEVMEKFTMDHMYLLAREATEGWDGMHGFEGEEGESEEECNERMEYAAEYYCEVWDEEEHAGRCTFSSGLSVEEVELF